MKRFLMLAVAGTLLWAGAGEARADGDCYGDRVVIRHYEPRRSSIRFSYGYGDNGWGHRRGYGRRWGHSYGNYCPPVRRYTQVVAPDYGAAYANTLVVNIRNSNGSYTPVTLRRVGNVYVGPRGEQYLSVPTEEQLRAVYGLE